jgi:hypothetical protein
MDRVFFLGGVAGVVAGFVVISYQALMFLQHGAWPPYSLQWALESISPSLGEAAASSGAFADALASCPLSGGLIALGLVFLWIAARLRNRYS